MRVLITGGAGFFGIHLTRALLNKGYNIRVIDTEDLNEPEIDKKVEFIKVDVRNKHLIEGLIKDIDFVIHNAAVLPISRTKKKIFWEVNVQGTRNVLEPSLKNKVKKFIFISSSAPYGIPKELPIREGTEFNPVCNYGRSKLEAERVCNEYRKKGLNIIILRPRTILGEGRLGIFQILFNWIAEGKNIYIIGRGDNLFQFLSERDLVSACILSLERDCYNEDFNLGAENYSTLKEDLKDLIIYAKSNSKIVSIPPKTSKILLRILDFLNLIPLTPWHYLTLDKPFYFDITKAKRILGWSPKDSNYKMLTRSYDWYLIHRKEIDRDFGTTHRKSLRQKILKLLSHF
ncbi:MAG: NAD(P)-dependent oxidoreductase [Candidatus Omnitrophica bacterium]|nr:NAD(P)-dependent oxidoreductase [Candidatus Omnitrophota bacterium]